MKLLDERETRKQKKQRPTEKNNAYRSYSEKMRAK